MENDKAETKPEGRSLKGKNEDEKTIKFEKNPLETANIFSVLSYSWINPLIKLGKRRQIKQEDLFPPHKKHTASFLVSRLEKTWYPALSDSKKSAKPAPKFWRHTVWPYRYTILLIFILTALESAQRITCTVILRQLLLWLQEGNEKSLARGYGLAVASGFLALLYPLTHHQLFNWGSTVGWNMRVQTMSLVNRKLLALTSGSLAHITTGHCITLMSTDVRRFDELFIYFPFLILAPIELLVVTLLIALELGAASAFAGIGALLALMPLQTVFARFLAQQRSQTVKFTDQRVKLTSEILNGILAVKMFAWEEPFSNAVQKIRDEEKKFIQRGSYTNAFNESMFFCGGALVALITFSTFHATGGHLQPFKIFYVLSLLQLPRLWMCIFFPLAIARSAESSVSFQRLQKFLELPEPTWNNKNSEGIDSETEVYKRILDPSRPSVEIEKGSFFWSSGKVNISEEPSKKTTLGNGSHNDKDLTNRVVAPSLRDVSFDLGRGEIVGITGKVGSGKSTLLAAVLGDLFVEGKVTVNAQSIAYASQKPFIVAGSLRENILFGLPLDIDRYQKVIEACALVRDIEALPNGDETEIGERGVNLSGGQKARVGLARVAYSEADLVLLDDPLSAVDPAVGRHIFQKCIRGILVGRSILLVTHQLQYLPKCDRVLVLKEGSMLDIGTFEELQSRIDFHGFVDNQLEDEEENDEREVEAKNNSKNSTINKMREGVDIAKLTRTGSTIGLVEEEGRVQGNVSLRVYAGYAEKMGYFSCFVIISALLIGQALICLSDWFLATWSRQIDQGGRWPITYMALVLAVVLVSFGRAILFFVWSLEASSRIHSGMLSCVLKAPLSFFHSNPIGRILNRFSADQGILDDMLPQTFFNFLQMVFICLGAFLIVGIGVPWVTLGMIPLVFVFLPLRRAFICTSRELKRLEAISRSPVYAHYSQTIQGLSTIRAFGAEGQFEAEFRHRLDNNGQGYFAWFNSARWLAFRLDSICALILLAATILAVVARNQLSPTLVGLALTYTLQLSGQVQWTVRQSAETENLFTGVERALEYTKLPEERLRKSEATRPPPDWPSEGSIMIENLTVQYRAELEPVLKELTVSIQGGHNVGIVGRTGAGKSTLMLALFRLVEASEGRIVIDDLDISMIGLEDLRRKVMAIPQDPVLFGSTLRFNLDPFNEYDDSQLWDALSSVQLKKKAEKLNQSLDSSMAEFGENFSVGERQLVCLARAILHHNKILIMDEATANVDLETDSLIQSTLRERFCDSTVLMIAHRMDTIIDADEVMVLDHGRLVEFGPPASLIERSEGQFSEMLRRTGSASDAILRRRVKRDTSN